MENAREFRLCGKHHFITYPQTGIPLEEALRLLRIATGNTHSYLLVARELHQDGHPHLHAFVAYANKKDTRDARKLYSLPGQGGINLESSRFPQKCIEYIKKDGDFLEDGHWDAPGKSRKEISAQIIKDIREDKPVTVGGIIEDNPQLLFGAFNLQRDLAVVRGALIPRRTIKEERLIWIVGDPGIGKSRTAREACEQLNLPFYLKAQNKWWDGYTNEDVVLLDDLDDNCLGHYLKLWGDRYLTTGETKGGQVRHNYRVFIITSNFTIERLFDGKPPETIAAIRRRAEVLYFT